MWQELEFGVSRPAGNEVKIVFKDVLQWPSGTWKLVHFEEYVVLQ